MTDLRAIAEAIKDRRFSDEWAGNAVRAYFNLLAMLDVIEAARAHLDPADIRHRHDDLRAALAHLDALEER